MLISFLKLICARIQLADSPKWNKPKGSELNCLSKDEKLGKSACCLRVSVSGHASPEVAVPGLVTAFVRQLRAAIILFATSARPPVIIRAPPAPVPTLGSESSPGHPDGGHGLISQLHLV